MQRVIVTGANGFIGSSLVKKLSENGVAVVAIDISFSNNRLGNLENVVFIESTIDESLLEKIPAGKYNALYHFAWRGVNGLDKANPYVQLENINLAVKCADICKLLGCNKFLVAGTVAENSVYSLQHLSATSGGMMYGVAKHSCRFMLETYCKNIGLNFVWMQFSNIFGVGNKTGNLVSYTLVEILQGHDATFGPAEQPYDFIYITDLLEAVYRLGVNDTPKSFYYIGSGAPRILKDYLHRIGELAGYPEYIRIGVRDDDGIKYSMEMFDTTDLVSAIGKYVSTDFDNGIKKTIEWLKM